MIYCTYTEIAKGMCMRMNNPEKRKYLYWMLAGFGAISLSVIFFFLLYRLQSVEEVLEEIVPISARLIANQAAYQFQYDAIRTLVRNLEEQL